MRTYMAWILILWFALVLENTWAEEFPSYSLVLPLAAGCIFRQQNSLAIMLAGTALLLRWLLHPSVVPVETASALICSVAFLSTGNVPGGWPPTAGAHNQNTRWRPVVTVTLVGLIAHAVVEAGMVPASTASLLWDRVVIAGPCLVTVVIAAWAADEFGLRSPHSVR